MANDLKAYLQLLSGLTEVTRQQAMNAARSLLSSGPLSGVPGLGQELSAQALRDQVAGLAAEISASGKANRDLLVGLISAEVERVVARLGLVSNTDLQAMESELDRLSARVRRLESGSTPAAASGMGEDVWGAAVAGQARSATPAADASTVRQAQAETAQRARAGEAAPTTPTRLTDAAAAKKAAPKKATTTKAAAAKASAARATGGAATGGAASASKATAKKAPAPAKKMSPTTTTPATTPAAKRAASKIAGAKKAAPRTSSRNDSGSAGGEQ